MFTCTLYNGHLYPSSLALQAMGCVPAAQNESLLSNSSQLESGWWRGTNWNQNL